VGHAAEEGKDIGGDDESQGMGCVFRMSKEILRGRLSDRDTSRMSARQDTVQIHVGEEAEYQVIHLIQRGLGQGKVAPPFQVIHEIRHDILLSVGVYLYRVYH
jgi:hypothetical protein